MKIFRVDNPHTKPFEFWEWCIAELKKQASRGDLPRRRPSPGRASCTSWPSSASRQSYTYFTWRNTKQELVEYFTELASSEIREYFRPNCWPNTPDILHETLQHGGRPAFIVRAVLAATLAANYGIYGPAYELQERTPREPGSEEYLNSEKYEIKNWDLERADSLAPLIERLNSIRNQNPALQSDWSLKFHPVDNDQLIAFSKKEEDNEILVVVNLDVHNPQSGFIDYAAVRPCTTC